MPTLDTLQLLAAAIPNPAPANDPDIAAKAASVIALIKLIGLLGGAAAALAGTAPANSRRGVRSTTTELREALSTPTRKRVDEHDVDAARTSMRCTSLDRARQSMDGSRDPLGAFVPDTNSADLLDLVAESIDLKQDVAAATRTLEPTERRLITRRFGLDASEPVTLATVAAELHVDTITARQLERSAFRKMRDEAGVEVPAPTPCKPAAAVLDLLRSASCAPPPAATAAASLMGEAQHA